jgi:ribosomal protein S18 acetylase RimI-like enzyme
MANIRKAVQTDAEKAVPLVIDAIGDIAMRMTGENEPLAIEKSLCELFKRNDNPHSYLYTYVAEIDGDAAGTMVLYPGVIAPQLDKNLSKWLSEKGAEVSEIDPEALPDELYINTICVDPDFRGKGIGSHLLAFAEDVARQTNISKVALNVETEKDAAIRLYKRCGYEIVSPWTIIGESFYHMVKIV